MRSYIFLLIFLASFLIPKIRDMIRDNAVGKQTRLGQNPKPQEASVFTKKSVCSIKSAHVCCAGP